MRNNNIKKILIVAFMLLCSMSLYAFNPKIERLGKFDNAECYMVDDTLLVLPYDLSKFQCGILTEPPVKDRYELIKYFNLRGYYLNVGNPYQAADLNNIGIYRPEQLSEAYKGSGCDTLFYISSPTEYGQKTTKMYLDYASFDYKDNIYENKGITNAKKESIGGFFVGESKKEICKYLGVPENLEFASVAILTSSENPDYKHDAYKQLFKDEGNRNISDNNLFLGNGIIVLSLNDKKEIKRIQATSWNSGKYINNTDRRGSKEEYIGTPISTEEINLLLSGFNVNMFLETPGFNKKLMEDEDRFIKYDDMKREISIELYDILQKDNIRQTVDSLLIKSSQNDSADYIKINEREAITIFFFEEACGMPTSDITMCDDYYSILSYRWVSDDSGKYDRDGYSVLEQRESIYQIQILYKWYQENKDYIKPVFTAYFRDLLSHIIALQYVYTLGYPSKEPTNHAIGVISGWKQSIWPYNIWKAYGPVMAEYSLKACGLFKSLISMFYWYKRNNINRLPPDYIIKCGIEMNKKPRQSCNNCKDPEFIVY